jgi:hypothetical protein
MVRLDELVPGDLIGVDWLDIAEDPTGDPAEASLARRHSIGFFWGRRTDEGVPVIITTTTLDASVEGQQGYCIYPEACITRVRMIKRKRRKKEVKI